MPPIPMRHTLLVVIVVSAMSLLPVAVSQVPTAVSGGLGGKLVSFSRVEEVYQLLYEAAQAGVLSNTDAAFNPIVFADVVASSQQLRDAAIAAGIVYLGQGGALAITPNGFYNFIGKTENAEIKNMLVRAGVVNGFGKFDQKATLDIITRYNPTTMTLDPKMPLTKEEEEAQTAAANKLPVKINPDIGSSLQNIETSKDTNLIKLETAKDIYQLVLQAYSSGIFDQEGNFMETAFKKLLDDEPVIARMCRSEKLVDENNKFDTEQAKLFANARPTLMKLLSDAGIYKNGLFSRKAISDIIFRYNEETGKLDKTPLKPVVEQVVKDPASEKESAQKLLDQEEETDVLQIIGKLIQNPGDYLRRVFAFGRRQCVFDRSGNFDSINLYSLISTNPSVLQLVKQVKIFNDDGVFNPKALYEFVKSKPDLMEAAQALGVMTFDGYYDQEATLAIVSQYPCRQEQETKVFYIKDPATVNTVADLKNVISRALTLKIFDKDGFFDYTRLQEAMDTEVELKSFIDQYGIFSNNLLKGAALRDLITSRPALKSALYATGLYDQFGAFNYKGFLTVIAEVSQAKVTPSLPELLPKADVFAYNPVRNRVANAPSATLAPAAQPQQPQQALAPSATTATTQQQSLAAASPSTSSWAQSNSTAITGLIIAIACVALLTIIFGTIACVRNKKASPSSKKEKEYHMV